MSETSHETLFAEHRANLLALAHRMLGDHMAAEDVLQEAFLRWRKVDLSTVRSPKAFLATAVTRLCINHLNMAQRRYETVGLPLEDFFFESSKFNPAADTQLAEALSKAFLRMLQTLTPTERAVFLLREGFDCDYKEISEIIDRSEDNCRQILRRAREHLFGQEQRFKPAAGEHERVLEEFLEASRTGDLKRVIDSLAADVILLRDGGNLMAPAPEPLRGEAPVSAYLKTLFSRVRHDDSEAISGFIYGQPCLLIQQRNEAKCALVVKALEGKVAGLRLITCPTLLRQLCVLLPKSQT